ncbi:MAG TPA: hypothetical protein VE997_08510, partial [Candidatus Limnocylindria bacterium]|jgi:hypothetical protein|nr:hypothetical protein [Candidatus Limnocylindria bacterium]
MGKRRPRLRIQLISAHGVFDAAQRLARGDAAQALEEEMDEDRAASEEQGATGEGRERPAAPGQRRRG